MRSIIRAARCLGYTLAWSTIISLAWTWIPRSTEITDWPIWVRWSMTAFASELFARRYVKEVG